jgi:lipopolysaccharide export system protein LptA
MRNCTTIFALALILGTAPLQVPACFAQNDSKSSSLNSLNSNALLGDSFNDKDFGKLPTNITSDTLTLHAKNRVFVYKGNVVVTQGDMKLTSNEIEGNYNEQNQIQKIVAKGDVVITKQEIEATSQRAIYDAVSSIVTLTDNPQLKQGESILIADRIKVLLNENRSQAEGNVRVTFVKTEGALNTGTGSRGAGKTSESGSDASSKVVEDAGGRGATPTSESNATSESTGKQKPTTKTTPSSKKPAKNTNRSKKAPRK